jgi:sortase (surface protein transpeptidase)
LVAAAAAIGAAAVAVGAQLNLAGGWDRADAGPQTPPAPSVVVSAPAEAVRKTAPTASAKPDPRWGQAAEAVRLEIPSIQVDAPVAPYTADDARAGRDGLTGQTCYQSGVIVCVDPPTVDGVYRQRGGQDGISFGELPGMDSPGTVYLYGHAGTRGGGAVFDRLPDLGAGDEALVTTANGVILYTVEEVFTVPKGDFPTDPRITGQEAGRLLLVSCDHSPGADTSGGYATDNVVAALRAVSAAPPAP